MRNESVLVCPFCDELAYIKPYSNKIMLPYKIYTLRRCTMGHEFYSVEEVPENQAAIVDEIREFRKDAREWKKYIRKSKLVENGYNSTVEQQ